MTPRVLVTFTVLLMSSGLAAVAQQQTGGVNLTDRIQGAGRVVVATATSVTPSWRTNAYGDRLIVSRVALQVEETMKGTPAGTVFVDIEGGTLDNVTLTVSSQTPVNVGDRAVFLLDDTSTGVTVPHLKGMGVLKLDANNQIQSLGNMRLDDVRRTAQAVRAGAVK